MTARLVVLASGHGTNLQAVMDGCRAGVIDADVVAVVSNHADAFALQRAADHGIPAVPLERRPDEARVSYDTRLAAIVARYAPDWVVLAGWMRILSMAFLSEFSGRVINLHPALPGQFPGVRAIERAFDAGVDYTGVMVHFVPDEGVDDGPVIATCQVPITGADTLATLTERVHAAERQLLAAALASICQSPTLQGNRR